MTNLELQGLLIISELEIYVAEGGTLPADIITAMDAFRKVELLTTGKVNMKVKQMVAALKNKSSGKNH